ncbi:TrbI/VirB10 family protein [Sporomusa sphaeroides]|uniref:Type IV secretion system protein virB10 n=1 Tax=Sporomusa sphaeroides DSM 2875 TaxID=1337886 RepID=A0A1U7MA50_9FIRM|nr:TrbI/VirB10 family protein [Sporomusa sphaeroides]OLS54305.1 type IV secretion system protein virB10 [Sporomusa sphaeroides DSM 2875]CVK21535.1 Type IV secretion system protein virB10 [Sporomusa sphaeroides DSM 2875]
MSLEFLEKINKPGSASNPVVEAAETEKEESANVAINHEANGNELAEDIPKSKPLPKPKPKPKPKDNATSPPSVIKADQAENHKELQTEAPPPKGVRFNRKVGILVVILLTIFIVIGLSFATTPTKKNSLNTSSSQTVRTGARIPDELNEKPKSYNSRQQQQPTQEKDVVEIKPIPNQNAFSSGNASRKTIEVPNRPGTAPAARENKSPISFNFKRPETGDLRQSMLTGGADSVSSPVATSSAAASQYSQNAQDEKRAFFNSQVDGSFYSIQRMQPMISNFEIKAGTIISGIMVSGIKSDLPGEIIGQVRENVFDSISGQYLLIPQGTKIIGRYDSKVAYGENRILIVWDRLTLPNGDSLNLEGMGGYDQAGYSGLSGHTDNHEGRITTAVLVTSILGAVTKRYNTNVISFGDVAIGNAAAGIANAGDRLMQKALDMQPTITIDPGEKFSIIVNKDFILKPYCD